MTRWLPGYKYRKKLTATASGTTATDYPVMWRVYYIAGTDATNQVFIPECQADLRDIRFTLDDGYTTLPYWVEHPEITGSGWNVWVKIPSILTTGTAVYLYYGRDSVASASNGERVFSFFDDFDGSALDTGKWGTTTTTTVSNSFVNITEYGGDKQIRSIKTFPYNYSTKCSMKSSVIAGGYYVPTFGFADTTITMYYCIFYGNWQVANKINALNKVNPNYDNSAFTTVPSINTLYTWEVSRNSTTQTIFNFNNTETKTLTNFIPTDNMGVVLESDSSVAATVSMDWVLVRPYVSSEPTCTISGIREVNNTRPILQKGWRL